MPDAEPVIIDDGGSTRIKQLKPLGNMDGLLGNSAGDFEAMATDQFATTGGTFRCFLRVRTHKNEDGAAHVETRILAQTDTVVIVSENQQKVELTFTSSKLLNIKLTSLVTAVNPIVEARQGNNN